MNLGKKIYKATFLEYTNVFHDCVSYNPTHELGEGEYLHTEKVSGDILVSEDNIESLKKFGIKTLTFVGYLTNHFDEI